MAREYARTRISIADDEDVEALSPAAQWLYFRVLIPEPTLSQCGVADWRPNRLLRKAAGLTLGYILDAAAELEQRRFALFDLETEEVLIRAYIRSDEILRNPKMAAAMIKAYRAIASTALRTAVAGEVVRVRAEHPEYTSWESPITKADLARLVTKSGASPVDMTDAYTDRIGNQISDRMSDVDPVPITVGIGDGNTDTDTSPMTDPIRCGFPAPAPEALSLHHGGGNVSPEGHQRDDPAEQPPPPQPDPDPPTLVPGGEPPEHCPAHPDGATAPCRACGDARRARADWLAADTRRRAEERSAAARSAADVRAAAIAACGLCDDHGYAGARVCDHDPTTPLRAARGSAQVRAALAERRTPSDPSADPEESRDA